MPETSVRIRKLAFGAVAALGVLAATPALADTAAVEAYAQQTIDHGIGILKDTSLTEAARQSEVRDFLLSIMDVNRIALYILGPAAQSAPPADVAAFETAFQAFTLANYEAQLGAYGGQTLKVVGATERAPGDYVVTANLVDPTDPPSSPPTPIAFRILDEGGGKYAIMDANVEGVWFEKVQHDDAQGFLAQNGGSLPKLVDHLNAMAAGVASAR
jgi:ABC-type transporter MlaC component